MMKGSRAHGDFCEKRCARADAPRAVYVPTKEDLDLIQQARAAKFAARAARDAAAGRCRGAPVSQRETPRPFAASLAQMRPVAASLARMRPVAASLAEMPEATNAATAEDARRSAMEAKRSAMEAMHRESEARLASLEQTAKSADQHFERRVRPLARSSSSSSQASPRTRCFDAGDGAAGGCDAGVQPGALGGAAPAEPPPPPPPPKQGAPPAQGSPQSPPLKQGSPPAPPLPKQSSTRAPPPPRCRPPSGSGGAPPPPKDPPPVPRGGGGQLPTPPSSLEQTAKSADQHDVMSDARRVMANLLGHPAPTTWTPAPTPAPALAPPGVIGGSLRVRMPPLAWQLPASGAESSSHILTVVGRL